MPLSMTGYSRYSAKFGPRELTIELRCVNSRFLDVNTKLPRALLPVEDRLRALVGEYITRGKLDVMVTLTDTERGDTELAVDEGYAAAYLEAVRTLCERFGLRDDMSAVKLAQVKDVFIPKPREEDAGQAWIQVEQTARGACGRFNEMRAAEGERLAADITSRLQTCRGDIGQVEALSPETTEAYKQRLENKLNSIFEQYQVSADPVRLMTEVALFADRVSVTEEIVRFRSHLDACAECIAMPGQVGRKLDFILQELGREINTVGSKAQDKRITEIVIEVKCELEKIREQIQNIE